MKVLVLALAVFSLPVAAADPAAKAPAKRTQKAAPKLEIPAGAVETRPGTFAYTDPRGKKWLYHKTPFGVTRVEDKGEPSSASEAGRVKAYESGDSVHFERTGLFGVSRWERKKTELTDEERGWLEQSRREPAAKSKRPE
jgi:hypothetical protein